MILELHFLLRLYKAMKGHWLTFTHSLTDIRVMKPFLMSADPHQNSYLSQSSWSLTYIIIDCILFTPRIYKLQILFLTIFSNVFGQYIVVFHYSKSTLTLETEGLGVKLSALNITSFQFNFTKINKQIH